MKNYWMLNRHSTVAMLREGTQWFYWAFIGLSHLVVGIYGTCGGELHFFNILDKIVTDQMAIT